MNATEFTKSKPALVIVSPTIIVINIRLSPPFPLITYLCISYRYKLYHIMMLFKCQNYWNKKHFNPAVNSKVWPHKLFPYSFMVGNFVLTNYKELLLYISYKQNDLYTLVTTNTFLIAITKVD